MSLSYLNATPAGALGQILSTSGHLTAGGKRIRLYGINMAVGAFMPMKSEAAQIATRLRKEGFNAVRLFGMDNPLATANTYTVTYKQQGLLNSDHSLNAVSMDVLDYFVSQLQENGIYISFPVHSGRRYLEAQNLCLSPGCEGVDNYLPELIQSQKDFASLLLNHVNPYTKKAYKEDPGVFAVEINNENSLTHRWANGTIDQYVNDPTRYLKFGKPLRDLFASWAQDKYGTIGSANLAWVSSYLSFADLAVPLSANKAGFTNQFYRDWIDFLGVTETSYWTGMHDYLKNTVGVKALVYGTQSNYTQPFTRRAMDLTDIHTYYGQPGTLTGQTNPTNGRPVFSGFTNTSVLSATDIKNAAAIGITEGKEIDKPSIITEAAYLDFNQYNAEAETLLTSYAGFQDLDAVFLFNYHGMNLNTNNQTYGGWYNMTVNAVTRVASALSFRRGDLTPGAPFVLKKTRQSILDMIAAKKIVIASYCNYWFGGDVRTPYTKNLFFQVVETPAEETPGAFLGVPPDPTGTYATTTGQIRWRPMDRITVNSPRTKAAIGYFNNSGVSLGGGIDVFVGTTMNNYAVVSVTSLNDDEVLPSNRMLLTLAGYYTVPGEWPRQPGQDIASWGTDTPRIEAVASTVRITTAANLKVTALDSAGARSGIVPVTRTGNYIEFTTGPTYATGWYLIEAQ